MAETSVLVRGARIVDGTGAPWYAGDVRIADGRIAAVGAGLEAAGARVVEAEGRYLAPGFIDAHCHDDLICLREPGRVEKVLQGVTSVVVGNCSFSLYPAPPGSAELLRGHFSGLLGETHPDEVFADLQGYRDALHRRGVAVNVVSLVGHAALRLAVMGYERRPASAVERARMQDLLARNLAAGAVGLSLGLVYPPSAYADAEELRALARTVADHGRLLAAHVRNYEGALPQAAEEFLGLLRASGAAGLLSHLQSAGRPNWGRIPAVLAQLEAARAEGVDVSFDMYPYPAGSSYILQLLPPDAQEGGIQALLARLDDPAALAVLRDWVEGGAGSKVALIGWGNIRISGTDNPALKHLEGRDMARAAGEAGVAPFDLLVRLVREDGGRTAIVMFQLDEADLESAFTHRLHMVGSDGLPRPGTRPHPRAFGAFPRVLGPLTRERRWFPLEDAVRRMTAMPAQRFGLGDRGLVRPGMAADLVLFTDQVADRADFDSPTLLPTGITDVWVAGRMVVADGVPTDARPGRLIGPH